MYYFPFLLVLAAFALCGVFASSGNEYKWCFDVLGVTPTDSIAVIKSRYRQLALLYHPDRLIARAESPEFTLHTMQDINEAYECVLRSFSTDELNPHFETGVPHSLSEKGTRLIENGWKLWEFIPKTERDEFTAQIKEYFGSEAVTGDDFFLVSKYWSSNDIEALQAFVSMIVFFLKILSALCTIGVITLAYILFKLLRWVMGKVWAVLRCITRFVWNCVSFRKTKAD